MWRRVNVCVHIISCCRNKAKRVSGEEIPRPYRIDAENICGADSADNAKSSHETERPEGGRLVVFNDIAGGTAEVIIEHEGQRYRLRATRNGRLLLNK